MILLYLTSLLKKYNLSRLDENKFFEPYIALEAGIDGLRK